MYQVKKLNNEHVKAVPVKIVDTRPIKGHNLFPEIYANIFYCAKKKMGKTSALFKTLKRCAGRNTKIVVFCSTLNKDASWTTIREWANKKGIPFVGHLGIKDENKVDRLAQFLEELQQPEEVEEKGFFESDSEEEEEALPKYRSPEYIFVLDDLSRECRLPSVSTLLKKNRHFKAKVIISSQYPNDLQPEAAMQLDYWILFKDHTRKKVDEIHALTDSSLDADEFYKLYKFATEQPFAFLYVDRIDGTFRRNFNSLISPS